MYFTPLPSSGTAGSVFTGASSRQFLLKAAMLIVPQAPGCEQHFCFLHCIVRCRQCCESFMKCSHAPGLSILSYLPRSDSFCGPAGYPSCPHRICYNHRSCAQFADIAQVFCVGANPSCEMPNAGSCPEAIPAKRRKAYILWESKQREDRRQAADSSPQCAACSLPARPSRQQKQRSRIEPNRSVPADAAAPGSWTAAGTRGICIYG